MRTTAERQHVGQLSPFVCACFTLNYIIGTGFLTLPWAFQVGGIALSCVAMALTCYISTLAADYILNAMARADALAVLKDNTIVSPSPSPPSSESNPLLASDDDKKAHMAYQSVGSHKESSCKFHAFAVEFDKDTAQGNVKPGEWNEAYQEHVKKHGRLLVSTRKFELTELCQIFLGKAGLLAYGISASLDIYGFLWAYSAVFGSAMSKLVPLFPNDQDSDYAIWLAIFACIVVPLSMLNLSEQAIVQVILSGCRILMLVLMIATPLAADWFGSGGNVDENIGPVPHFGQQSQAMGASWVDLGGIHKMFPAVVFSLLFHQAVPGLADEMKDKPRIGLIFGYTFILCGVAYGLLGFVGAWYFGEDVYQSSNINWHNYHGGTGTYVHGLKIGKMAWTNIAPWAQCIRTFVVIFPAIDVVSAYPLYAYTLGNTLLGLFHADNVQELQRNRRVLTFYRALAAIPPIVGGLYMRELGVITDYSGLVGLAIAFCFPPLLHMTSERQLRNMGAPYRTRYERFGSSRGMATAMFWFGVISIFYCFILLVSGS